MFSVCKVESSWLCPDSILTPLWISSLGKRRNRQFALAASYTVRWLSGNGLWIASVCITCAVCVWGSHDKYVALTPAGCNLVFCCFYIGGGAAIYKFLCVIILSFLHSHIVCLYRGTGYTELNCGTNTCSCTAKLISYVLLLLGDCLYESPKVRWGAEVGIKSNLTLVTDSIPWVICCLCRDQHAEYKCMCVHITPEKWM